MEGTRKASTRCILFTIRLYRYLVSPLLPKCCRFYPTCSQYALEAVRVHGIVRGLYLATLRVLRCHPFHPGGYDPVPPQVVIRPFLRQKKREKKKKNGMESIFSNNTVYSSSSSISDLFCKVSGYSTEDSTT